jgi:hypothetical protein
VIDIFIKCYGYPAQCIDDLGDSFHVHFNLIIDRNTAQKLADSALQTFQSFVEIFVFRIGFERSVIETGIDFIFPLLP